jgi:Coenzyme PQQ synthesis protein D (PqqD)
MASDARDQSVFRKREGIVARRVAGEILLVPIQGELAKLQRIFVLTPVAEYVWERLDGRTSLGAIGEGVAAEFAGDPAEAASDLGEFVGQLRSEGLDGGRGSGEALRRGRFPPLVA